MDGDQTTDGIQYISCDTAAEFTSYLDRGDERWGWNHRAHRHDWIFRGHADAGWSLTPSAWRRPEPIIDYARNAVPPIPLPAHDRGLDLTGTLVPPPGYEASLGRDLIVQANAEIAIVSQFIHRCDDLGLNPLATLPPAVHSGGVIDVDRPVAADDFIFDRMSEAVALAQHHGVPTRMLDWSDDPLIAAYFALGSSTADRLAVWALNEHLAQIAEVCLWPQPGQSSEVGMQLKVVRPPRSQNSYLRAQRGAFTLVYGAGCYALVNAGKYPDLTDFAKSVVNLHGEPLLRCVTLPRSEVGGLNDLLMRHGVSRETLMPSLSEVAQSLNKHFTSHVVHGASDQAQSGPRS